MPMENLLFTVARVLDGFEFTFADHDVDEGESVVKHAVDFYSIHGGKINDEAYQTIRRYIACRYADMKRNAIQWHRPLPVLFSGDEISFNYLGTSVSGSVLVSPKTIGLTMYEPFKGLHDEAHIQASVPLLFTQEPEEGSPANTMGIDCARRMLERLFFCHRKQA